MEFLDQLNNFNIADKVALIGLVGESGSGKDYTAGWFKNYTFESMAFADKIREYIFEVNPQVWSFISIKDLLEHNTWDALKSTDFNFPFYNTTQETKEKIVERVRKLVQDYGQAGRKVFGEEHWINLILPPVKSLWGKNETNIVLPKKTLITDVRRLNEAQAIKDRGGYIIRIERVDQPKKGDWRTHITETELHQIPFDFEIVNDINHNTTMFQVQTILRKIFKIRP